MNLFRSLVPPSRNGRLLAVGGTVDSIGSGLFLAVSTLYFVQTLGLPAVAVGTALATGSLCGLLSPVPLGRLADKVGAKKIFVALLCVRAVGYASYTLVADYPVYFVLTCMLAAADAASAPLLQAVIGDLVPSGERTATMASIRAIRNIGLGAGFLLAAGVQSLQWVPAFYILFAVNGVSFLATGLAIRRARPRTDVDSGGATADPGEPTAVSRAPYRDKRFVGLVLANTLAMLHDSLLFVLFPLWIVTVLELPAYLSSILLAVNTLQTTLLQGYIGRLVRGLQPSVRAIQAGCGLLIVTCVIFGAASGVQGMMAPVGAVIGVITLTLAENVLMAASWELSYVVAPDDRRAQYLAFFSLGFSGQRAIGPLLMTAVVLPAGYIGWVLLSGLFVLAAGGTALAARPGTTT